MGGRLRVHDTPVDEFGRQKRRVLTGIVDVFSSVVAQFETRDGVTGDDYVAVLEDPTHRIAGSSLGQRPSSFAEQYVVHPLLEVLGYDYVVGSRVRFERFAELDSTTFAGFRLTNTSYARRDRLAGAPWGDESAAEEHRPEVVGETAGLNAYADAKEEIRETYVHPFTHVDVGIATDGLDWGVYVGVAGTETWEELSLRPFALKVVDHVLDAPVPRDAYADADDRLVSFLEFLHKPNFEQFLY